MSLYEHTIVARQDTSESQLKQLKDKYAKIIEKYKGEIIKTEDWGLMNLSYEIKKNKKGNYIHFKIEIARQDHAIIIRKIENEI